MIDCGLPAWKGLGRVGHWLQKIGQNGLSPSATMSEGTRKRDLDALGRYNMEDIAWCETPT
jgi:hypothetical protein